MKCVEAQGLITKYISDELHGEQLEEFLKHIEGCEDCKEELEIYYVIMKGMQQIDEDNVLDYNFHRSFEKELRDSRTELVASNKKFVIKFMLLEIIIVILAMMLTKDVADFDNNHKSKIDTFNGIVID